MANRLAPNAVLRHSSEPCGGERDRTAPPGIKRSSVAKLAATDYMACMIDRRSMIGGLAAGSLWPRVALAGTSASTWSSDLKSAARLIAAGTAGQGAELRHLIGLEIRLDERTKTYWRTPGDSGVPPHFDWSGSTNLADVAVSWPAPLRFADGGGFSIGYKRSVVLPLVARPRVPEQPVRLGLKLGYAVCDEMCIPAKAELALTSRPGAAADPALVALRDSFLARVPRPEVPGLSLAVESLEDTGRHPVVVFLARLSDASAPADLFVEGPDESWALPLPAVLDAAGAVRRFRLELDGVPRGTDPLSQPLTCTLVAGDTALETRLRPA